jgi:hypothetical protein
MRGVRKGVLGIAVLIAAAAALAGSALAATARPSITSFTPTGGKTGVKVTITGKNLTGATAVKFDGATASFAAGSATKITATVPAKVKTGAITVTTKAGTAKSAKSFTAM